MAPRRQPKAKQGAKTVHIRVDGEDITVDPTATHLDVGQDVEWHLEGEQGTMLLTFVDGEAVGETKLRAAPGRAARGKGRKKGVFHYQVAIYTGEELHVDVGCPTIIIR